MFIRSQNRDVLVNVNDICFNKLNIHSEIIYQFRCYGYGDDYYILGEYSTEKKAMKVMDMIEDRIRLSEMFKLHIYEPLNRTDQFVFQLPKDDDVEV